MSRRRAAGSSVNGDTRLRRPGATVAIRWIATVARIAA
jgi:hypothetical protein